MKILIVSHTFPYPPNEGIKMPQYNRIKEHSKRHKIILLSFIDRAEREYVSELKRFCEKVEVLEHRVPKSPFLRLNNILFQKKPFCVHQFFSNRMASKLVQIVQEEKPDVIHFEFVNTAIYRDYVNNQPTIFFPYDAMSMLFYRSIGKEQNLLKKVYLYSQWKKMKYFEAESISGFDKTVVVSPVDRNWLLKYSPGFDISVIPNGVDTSHFKPLNVQEDNPSVLFRGIMSFQPNVDAVLYFADNILPKLRNKIPNLKLYIVGPNPVKSIRLLSDNPLNIVTGSVPDLREYMAKATVNIAPMVSGSGIKNKILEAMAMSKPVVSTALGCDGIPDAKNGDNLLIARTDDEFVNDVELLIKDENLRKELGENSRKFVEKNYTWQKCAEKFEKIYQQAIEKHKNR